MRLSNSFSAAPCISSPQEGSLQLGDTGFVATVGDDGDQATLVCQDNGNGGFLCEHSWLEGDFEIVQF